MVWRTLRCTDLFSSLRFLLMIIITIPDPSLVTHNPAIVNRTNQVNGSVVVVRWKPCTASLFTIYHREMLSEGKSHWKAVNVSRHETSYDLHLGCQKEHEIAVTAWNSSAETPLTAILKHCRFWRVRTFGGENTE